MPHTENINKHLYFFLTHRPVPYPESSPAGIWWELQGEGQSTREHPRHFQCVQRLLGWSSESRRDGGAHGDGAGQWQRWTGSAQNIMSSTVENESFCYSRCSITVLMAGHICSPEQDADWSGWAAESRRQPKRTWRKDTWEWGNGGKKFRFWVVLAS